MSTMSRTKSRTQPRTKPRIQQDTRGPRTSPLVGWLLLVGGVLYFVGGGMHPKEDPPDVTLKEHLLVMYQDPAWYPAHAVFFVGMALLAAALVAQARGGSLRHVPAVHTTAVVAAVTTTVATAGSLLHLVSGAEADRIAAGRSTPITDVQVIFETITVPVFAASITALAVTGAMTHTIGNWLAAVTSLVGGVSYALAAGTFLLTDRMNFLFPISSGIALWAIVAGIGLLLRGRAARRT